MNSPSSNTENAEPFRKIWRRLYWLRQDIRFLLKAPWRRTWAYIGHGGIGDELLCSALAWEHFKRSGRGVVMLCRHPELFLHNPSVIRTYPADRSAVSTFSRWNLDMRVLCEWQPNHDDDRQVSPARHIIAENLMAAGVHGEIDLRPRLFLSESELQEGVITNNQVVIQSSGRAASYYMSNKDWIEQRYVQLAETLKHRCNFVQLGSEYDPPIPGAIDLRGKTSLRKSASILARSRYFIGQVGFLMHLARAVDTRSVIIYGGRELPSQSGYSCNENIATPMPCAPCWRRSKCDFGKECMTRISVDDVVSAVDRIEARLPTPLETDFARI